MKRLVIAVGLVSLAWLMAGGSQAVAVVLPSSADLQLWLDASAGITESGGLVSQWDDQSSLGHNLAQSDNSRKPLYEASAITINGLPALRFNTDGGTTDFMASAAFLDTRLHSIFAVVKPSQDITYNDIIGTSGLSSGDLLMGRYLPDDARAHYHDGVSLKGVNATASPTDLSPSLSYQEANSTHVVSRWNGGTPGSRVIATYNDRNATAQPVYLATRGAGNSDVWKGDIAEVIIYDVALSEADRIFVENYLSGKYGFGTAGSQIWDGGGTDANISTAGNWSPDGAFVSGNQMVFTGSAPTTPNVDTLTTVAGIAFQSQAASFTVEGSALTVNANGITNWSSNVQTIDNAVVLGTSQTWDTVGGLVVNGIVSGGHGLTKEGEGTLTLADANTFGGALTVADGTLSIGTWNNVNTAGPLGQSANKVQLNGGAIQYTGGDANPTKSLDMVGAGTIDVVQAGTVLNLGAAGLDTLTGSGNITKEGLGTLQLAKASVAQSAWVGKLIINAGTVDFFGSDSMPKPASFVADAVQINDGGTFAFSYSGTSPSVSQPNTNIGFQLAGDAGFAITAGTHTLQGVIADKPGETGNLIKTGAGTLVLGGNNTYTGTTTIDGTLQVGTGGAAGTLGSGIVVNNGALVINRSGTLALAQDISGAGSLTKTGSGSLVLSGANNLSGSTTISGGSIVLQGSNSRVGTGSLTLTNGAALDLGGNSQTVATVGSSGSGGGIAGSIENGDLYFTGNMYVKSGTISANLSNAGGTTGRLWIGGDAGATVTLGGNNTYTYSDASGEHYATIIGHNTTGAAGTVKLAHENALGLGVNRTHVYSGTLDLNGVAGLVQEHISLLGAGVTLANSTGAASTGATIFLGESGRGAGGDISVADGASLTLNGLVTNTASPAPSLDKLGSGMLILNAANNYDGNTNISAGILGAASTAALPGWNVAGRYTVATGAVLALGRTQFDANAVTMLDTGNFQSGASIGRLFDTTSGGFTHTANMADVAHASGAATALVKVGANTLTLTGSNTYTGSTVVGAGTLAVNGSTHANSGVTVYSGATLGGTGTVGGATTVQAGGRLATGNSIGTLNFGSSLALENGAVWDWEYVDNTPGNYDQAVGPQLVLPASGNVTLNIHGLAGHSVFPEDKFTVFAGDVQNFSQDRVTLVNHSKWTNWDVSTGGSLVLTANPTISLSTDVLNAGRTNPAAWNGLADGFSNGAGVELVRYIGNNDANPLKIAYTQAAVGPVVDVAPWVISGNARGASQGLQVNGYDASSPYTGGSNLYLRGESNEPNEGFGAHANWIVTFDLDAIREEHFAGTGMPFQLTGEFGTWGGIGSDGANDGVVQGAIFLDGVRIDSMDPSIANPTESMSIRNLDFDLTISSGRYLTFGIFNEANSTVWDDAVFKNVNLTMIPEPGTWLMLLAACAAGLLVRRRRR